MAAKGVDVLRMGRRVKLSNLIERATTDTMKARQVDLARYLPGEQSKRNARARRAAFAAMIVERLAILTIDGEMSETNAGHNIERSGLME